MTLLSLLGLALLDSLNPSALALTLYLLGRPRPSAKVSAYLGGMFTAYLTVGVLLLLGLDALLGRLGTALEHPVVYALQGFVGAAMLIYSFVPRNRPAADQPAPALGARAQSGAAAGFFVLGVSVTALELPTAFPYLGAISVMTNAAFAPAVWLPLLIGYNLIFILPPLLLLLAHQLLGQRLEARFARWRERLQREARETMLWIVGIVGFLLLWDALAFFEFFGVLR